MRIAAVVMGLVLNLLVTVFILVQFDWAPVLLGLLLLLVNVVWWSAARWRVEFEVALFAVVVLALLTFGWWHPQYPPQDLELLSGGVRPGALAFTYKLWGPRFICVYPSVVIRDLSTWRLDYAFGLYSVATLSMMMAFLLSALRTLASGVLRGWVGRLVFILAWAAIVPFMNGRLANALLGMGLILWTQVRAYRAPRLTAGSALLQSVGLYLMMMSSGTMWVGAGQILVGDLGLARRHGRSRDLLLPALLLGMLAPFFFGSGEKNLDFWQDSLSRLLLHGWGFVFWLEGILTAAIFLATAFLIVGLIRYGLGLYLRGEDRWLLVLNLILAILGGSVGYSTGVMGLPAVSLLAGATGTWLWSHRKNGELAWNFT